MTSTAASNETAEIADPLDGTVLLKRYLERTKRSGQLAREAKTVLPSGVTHDSRHVLPHGLYIEHASGPRKWDVDGNEYVDYYGGHGALMLGHNDPDIRKAINAGLDRGTQFGAGHADEVAWARKIIDMVPSAERVRFTSSGTEATLMAVRLARAFTGRGKILRFPGHYHGWQDDMTTGYRSHFNGGAVSGVPAPVAANTMLADIRDIRGLQAIFKHADDIAAVIFEPLGAATGQVPMDPVFIAELRDLTQQTGVLMIFDEVVTGFRVSAGGVQEKIGVTPDLTSLAKIVAGGLPGGAVAGRKDILDHLDFAASAAKDREKVYHPGTFNANPVSAAAGIATLSKLADGKLIAATDQQAATLRASLNDILADHRVPWAVYGQSSAFHLFMNPNQRTVDPRSFDPNSVEPSELTTKTAETVRALRLAMNVHGVDLSGWPGGLLSSTHGEQEHADTVAAFASSIEMMRADGLLPNNATA